MTDEGSCYRSEARRQPTGRANCPRNAPTGFEPVLPPWVGEENSRPKGDPTPDPQLSPTTREN